jgi:hypothetical protein
MSPVRDVPNLFDPNTILSGNNCTDSSLKFAWCRDHLTVSPYQLGSLRIPCDESIGNERLIGTNDFQLRDLFAQITLAPLRCIATVAIISFPLVPDFAFQPWAYNGTRLGLNVGFFSGLRPHC